MHVCVSTYVYLYDQACVFAYVHGWMCALWGWGKCSCVCSKHDLISHLSSLKDHILLSMDQALKGVYVSFSFFLSVSVIV